MRVLGHFVVPLGAAFLCLSLTAESRNIDCLSYINNFRASIGVPALSYNQGQEQCANNQARMDQSGGFHGSFGQCNEDGQCQCYRGANDVQGCIQAYINEGPGGGHYRIIADPSYKSVACGEYEYGGNMAFYSQGFYTTGGSGGGDSQPPQPSQQDRPQQQQPQQTEQQYNRPQQQQQQTPNRPKPASGGSVQNDYPVVYIPGVGNFQMPGLWDILSQLGYRSGSKDVKINTAAINNE